jgi:hypothetical protein
MARSGDFLHPTGDFCSHGLPTYCWYDGDGQAHRQCKDDLPPTPRGSSSTKLKRQPFGDNENHERENHGKGNGRNRI